MISADSSLANNYPGASADLQHQAMGVFCGRITGLCKTHWDFNALWQFRKDAENALKMFESDDHIELRSIVDILNTCINSEQLPDAEQTSLLLLLSQEMQNYGVATVEPSETKIKATPTGPVNSRIETPPKSFWRQWTDQSTTQQNMDNSTVADSHTTRKTKMNTQDVARKPTANGTLIGENNHLNLRIYHLTDYNKLSLELDQLIEKKGMDIELLNTLDELVELLQALPANMVLIDPSFLNQADAIKQAVTSYRELNSSPLAAVQITDIENKSENLQGVFDACINASVGASAIVSQIDQLLRFGKADQFRVLIVEDDRSQAMFAEGILRNAEITTKVMLESDGLLDAIEEFTPDLILMDLHMPQASGIELTELIRKSDRFQNTPVVFLSGEVDEDKQLDALEAGGDDFLSKPIRPRRLIAAVQNRIKRHRALKIAANNSLPQNPNLSSGLSNRSDILEQINRDIQNTKKVLLFIELNGFGILKGKLGITALEQLLKDFSAHLVKACTPKPVARFGDGSFVLIYEGDCSDEALTEYATQLRVQLMKQRYEVLNKSIELRLHIGICHFDSAKGDVDLLINAAERTAHSSRNTSSGVEIFRPQSRKDQERDEKIAALLHDADKKSYLSHIYQPIVAVAGSEEKQFQTLLRLQGDNGIVVPAATFIPIAEKTNLIVSLDRWSIAKAIEVINEHAEKETPIKLFVNQSNTTLLYSEQLVWLKNLLKASPIAEDSLVIEINYEDALLNQQAIQEFCKALIYDRVQFCLSRYNPKNDEPNLLENLPLNYIKLARQLTLDLSSQAARDEVKVLVDKAHRLGLEVIGHSVEDAQTAATLWMNGIDYIQGNLVQTANNHLEFGFDQSVL